MTLLNEYTDWSQSSNSPHANFETIADILSDGLIIAPLIRVGLLHASTNNRRSATYFYSFAHQTENSDNHIDFGSVHGEDLPYVFGAPLLPPGAHHAIGHFPYNYTRAESQLSEALITYWSNFAKTGDTNLDPRTAAAILASPGGASSSSSSAQQQQQGGRFKKVSWPMFDQQHQQYFVLGKNHLN